MDEMLAGRIANLVQSGPNTFLTIQQEENRASTKFITPLGKTYNTC